MTKTSEGICWNKYEVAARTKKVNKMLAQIAGHPAVAEAIREDALAPPEWDQIAAAARVIPAGIGARKAIRTILLQDA